MSCLDNVIGLSPRTCACLGSEPGDWSTKNASHSGFYVDNHEWTFPLKDDIFDDCGSTGIFQTLEDARSEGIVNLNAHLLQEIEKYQTAKFGNVQTTIGQKQKYTTNLNSMTGDIVGYKMSPVYAKGTILRIKKISVLIQEAGTYAVKLMKEDGTELETVNVTGGSNTANEVAVDWKHRFTQDGESIYVIYDRSSGYPIDSKIYCLPCRGTHPAYTNFLTIRGVQAADTSSLVDASESLYSYGLFTDISYQCDYIDWLCDMYADFWSSSQFGSLYSKCLQLYACQSLNNKIINSGKVNYYTLVESKNLIAKNIEIGEILSEIVPQLAARLPNDFVDCFCKKSRHNMQIRTLTVT